MPSSQPAVHRPRSAPVRPMMLPLVLGLLASPVLAWRIDSGGNRCLLADGADTARPAVLTFSVGRPQAPTGSAPPNARLSIASPGDVWSAVSPALFAARSGAPAVARPDTRIHLGRFHPERLPIMALATALTMTQDDGAIRAMRERIPQSVRRSWPVQTVSFLGGVGPPVAAGAMILFGDHKLHDTGKMALTAIVVNAAIVSGLKTFTGRQRPVGLPGAGGFYGPGSGYDSFPSGHASGAFAFATVVGKRHKKWKWWLYGGATLVAASRVLLDAHHPSDVLAGALIGVEVGNLVLGNEGAIARISIKF